MQLELVTHYLHFWWKVVFIYSFVVVVVVCFVRNFRASFRRLALSVFRFCIFVIVVASSVQLNSLSAHAITLQLKCNFKESTPTIRMKELKFGTRTYGVYHCLLLFHQIKFEYKKEETPVGQRPMFQNPKL